jgi:hypothetical protein
MFVTFFGITFVVFVFWIFATTVCAVLRVLFRATTIPAIPVTSARVIVVITISITSPLRHVTGSGALLGFILVPRILAGAGTIFQDILRLAKMIFRPASLATFHWPAAVATIKITISVIILWIAMGVAFEMSLTDLSRFQFRLVFRVQTLTLGAVKVVVIFGRTAAVATVPTTTTVIVCIIARFVSLPCSFLTWFGASNALEFRVFATAIFTV